MQNQTKTMEELEMEIAHFKQSMNEWIIYLSKGNKDINERMLSIERRLTKLELDSSLKL